MMTEADILASTYYDKMNVYRAYKKTLPNGESVFKNGLEGKKIYENIECALSSFSGSKAHRNDVNVKVEADYKLFYDPKIKVEKNDVIECFHDGMIYILRAGKPFSIYSHVELPVSEIKDTA